MNFSVRYPIDDAERVDEHFPNIFSGVLSYRLARLWKAFELCHSGYNPIANNGSVVLRIECDVASNTFDIP